MQAADTVGVHWRGGTVSFPCHIMKAVPPPPGVDWRSADPNEPGLGRHYDVQYTDASWELCVPAGAWGAVGAGGGGCTAAG